MICLCIGGNLNKQYASAANYFFHDVQRYRPYVYFVNYIKGLSCVFIIKQIIETDKYRSLS